MKFKNDIERSNFAKNLISIRKSKGLSQRDLAKMTGISNRVIAYYELRSEIPSYEKLELLARALKISIAELIDPNLSDKKILKLDTWAIKKVELLKQLPPEDQRKVVDYIKDLIDKNSLKKQLAESKK